MVRKKVNIAFITNDSARKVTFKKRKKGLIKKVEELSTLCGVDACAIIYSPYDNEPELWPNSLGVQNLLSHFKTLPKIEQIKKMDNQESFVRQNISKVEQKLKKIRRDNREMEINNVISESLAGKGFGYLNIDDLTDVCWMAEQRLEGVNHLLDEMRKGGYSNGTKMPSNNASE